jgi:hypothetical protein
MRIEPSLSQFQSGSILAPRMSRSQKLAKQTTDARDPFSMKSGNVRLGCMPVATIPRTMWSSCIDCSNESLSLLSPARTTRGSHLMTPHRSLRWRDNAELTAQSSCPLAKDAPTCGGTACARSCSPPRARENPVLALNPKRVGDGPDPCQTQES